MKKNRCYCPRPDWHGKLLPVKRRHFLQGMMGAGLFMQLPLARAMVAETLRGTPRVAPAIYQDMAYLDATGMGQRYVPPQGNAATREYLDSLTDEQRLTLQYSW